MNSPSRGTFWLGIPEPAWLARVQVPTLVSANRLSRRVALPVALEPWVLDCGAYSNLVAVGAHALSPVEYARLAARAQVEVGRLAWAACQDWPCEPGVLARTGLSIAAHQGATIRSWLTLSELAPGVPWLPVLQGWHEEDYLRHVDRWLDAGVDLVRAVRVGVGTLCRRRGDRAVASVVTRLSGAGIPLHAFGVKGGAVRQLVRAGHDCDSAAWSYRARRARVNLCGRCARRDCRNCLEWALSWAEMVSGAR